eukprot:TRINITY_DN24284_c0_g1_i1.p1 TRINITY_DN24284_c0_g1~~TRINITY_DN24284_c0_g1_i1.p1  ORF type:complete len:108 (-),score=26.96 TRINITY_DN24284_c0_g1_i1:50-373(-)
MTSRESGGIPIRRDGWYPTPRDISATPGGTLYCVTPGGTRIVYDRSTLLNLRNSPLSKTPTNLPVIPGVTAPEQQHKEEVKQQPIVKETNAQKPQDFDDNEVFEMER